MITIVGMGIAKEDITLRGVEAVRGARQVFVRTARTHAAKTLQGLGVEYIACDDLYETAPDFDALADAIVARLVEAGDCVYCVDGAGTQDYIVQRLAARTEVCVVPGVDAASAAMATVCADGQCYLRQSATDVVAQPIFFAPDATLVVDEIDDAVLAGELQLKLLDAYGDSVAWLIDNRGNPISITLADLARQKGYGAHCCLVVPRGDLVDKQRFTFGDVVRILYRLRLPDGCEWDRTQTHASIRDCCIEEAYELVEAIDLEDIGKMMEETGDVLLQAIFHTAIARDAGEFDYADMLSDLAAKLIRRHPHVFGDVVANNADEALAAWDAAKAVEKKQVSYTQKMQQVAPMSALMRAKKIQKIAAKAHYDFDSATAAADKIGEELAELFAAPEDRRELEGGDLLFACVNVLRLMHIDPELALLQSTRKFVHRFTLVEQALAQRGIAIDQCPVDEMWRVYDAIKAQDDA